MRLLQRHDGLFFVASFAVHLVVGGAIAYVKRTPTAPRRPIEVAIGRPPPPAPAPPSRPEPPRPPVAPPPVVPPRDKRPPAPALPGKPPPPIEAPASTQAPPPVEAPAATQAPSPRRLDLFAGAALEKAVGPTGNAVILPASLGVTRRADGSGNGGGRDQAADKEEASARIRQWADEAQGRELTQSGRVAPRWREAERKIDLEFKPSASLITDENGGESWLKQMMQGRPESGSTPRAVDDSANGDSRRYEQALAGQALMNKAAASSWIRTEVEVILDEQGQVVSARVTRRSGRRRFDQAALEAVQKAMAGKGVVEEKGGVVTRWAVEAAPQVSGPLALGFSFDESTGKIGGNYPGRKEIKTKVALLSVQPRQR